MLEKEGKGCVFQSNEVWDCGFVFRRFCFWQNRISDFAIFFPPLAAHAPCCVAPNGPDKIKKVVVKILAE